MCYWGRYKHGENVKDLFCEKAVLFSSGLNQQHNYNNRDEWMIWRVVYIIAVLVVIMIRMPQVQKIAPNIYLINLLRGDWQWTAMA